MAIFAAGRTSAGWHLDIGDFRVAGRRVTLRKTGNSAAIDRALVAELWAWGSYYAVVRARALVSARRRERPAVWFTPDPPAARYLVRTAGLWAGVRFVDGPEKADRSFYFEDATTGDGVAGALNGGCRDISKSRVAAVFADVFGYPLGVDPAAWDGPAVEKSEANGTHDGHIVACPCAPMPGKAYQRVVDNLDANGLAVDLRTQCVGGRPVVVWVKRRRADARFLPPNVSVQMRAPEQVFSEAELAALAQFCTAMGADWCGLDVLRDSDGRIYVVDVNKTDAGPIIALSLADKLRGTSLLAAALRDLVKLDRYSREGGNQSPMRQCL